MAGFTLGRRPRISRQGTRCPRAYRWAFEAGVGLHLVFVSKPFIFRNIYRLVFICKEKRMALFSGQHETLSAYVLKSICKNADEFFVSAWALTMLVSAGVGYAG